MRTFTTEHTVYAFEELSDDAKEKAIAEQRDGEYEVIDEWLGDELVDKLVTLLAKNKMTRVIRGGVTETPKVYYSLGYSQGDGAMFEGEVSWRGYTAIITHAGRYYHYNSRDIELVTAFGDEASSKAYDQFDDIYIAICKELERYGYSTIESAISDENIIENIKLGAYEFYADGRIA